MKTTLDIPDSVYREFKVKTAQNGDFRDAGMAEPFITRFPDDLIHGGYLADNKTTVACEKSFRRLPLTEVLP